MEKYTIYKLIDPVTNSVRYIGLTINTLKQRLKSHLNERGKSHKINWVQKLKLNNLKPLIEVLEDNIYSYDEACLKEIYYIDLYKETCDLTNSASGGNKNKRMSVESRKKMSESQTERYKTYKKINSEETKEKIRASTKLRMQDPEEIKKLKISNKKYEDSKTEDQKLDDILKQPNKWVVKYDKEMNFIDKYPSIRYAERKTGIYRTNISKCCSGKVPSAGGYVWRFIDDKFPVKKLQRGRRPRSVIQYDKSMNYISEYSSVKDASYKTNTPSTGIFYCCVGKYKHSNNFIWKYK